jgi:hypothetical protein
MLVTFRKVIDDSKFMINLDVIASIKPDSEPDRCVIATKGGETILVAGEFETIERNVLAIEQRLLRGE